MLIFVGVVGDGVDGYCVGVDGVVGVFGGVGGFGVGWRLW